MSEPENTVNPAPDNQKMIPRWAFVMMVSTGAAVVVPVFVMMLGITIATFQHQLARVEELNTRVVKIESDQQHQIETVAGIRSTLDADMKSLREDVKELRQSMQTLLIRIPPQDHK